MSESANRYRSDFREAETNALMHCARSGDSALIMGVGGVGKSNFFRHLLSPEVQRVHLGEQAGDTFFIRVNFHDAPDLSIRTIYSLILEQMEMLDEREGTPTLTAEQMQQLATYHEALLRAGDDLLRVRRAFRQAMRVLLRERQRRLVLLFDQFDEIFWAADARLLTNLRGLRESYKYRLSFFVFMRSRPASFSKEDRQREEFYELLSSNLHGLKPYDDEDALAMIERLTQRQGQPLNPGIASVFIDLSGGHAGLLRALYLAHLNKRLQPVGLTPVEALQQPDVRLECESIWNSLSGPEQQVLLDQVQGTDPLDPGQAAVQDLRRKGVLDGAHIFSPIFSNFLLEQDPAWSEPLYLEQKSRQLWIDGELVEETLSPTEFAVFQALYHRQNEVVSKEELLHAGWPTEAASEFASSTLSPALSAVIYRLRQKLGAEERETPNIETFPGQGWRLNIKPQQP